MLPSDVAAIRTLSTPTASGDPCAGSLTLVAVSTPDLERDTYRSEIYRVSEAGAVPVPWTGGDADSSPIIAPDGRSVAFLRKVDAEGGTHPQIMVIPADGGEARAVTALPLGAEAVAWSPDSRRLAALARIPESGRYGVPAADGRRVETAGEAPRHIRRLDYRLDGAGFVLDQPKQLVVVDVERALGGELVASAVTALPVSVGSPVWTPDSRAIVAPAPRDLGASETLDADLYRFDPETGEASLLVRTEGSAEAASFGPDGTLFWVGTGNQQGPVAEPGGLWAARPGSTPTSGIRLTDRSTVDVVQDRSCLQVRDGEVLVAVLNRGAVEIRQVPWTGVDDAPGAHALTDLPVVLGGQLAVRGFVVAGGAIVATVADPGTYGEVVRVDSNGGSTRMTDFGASLRRTGVRSVEELHGTAPDGYPVHGWLVLPEGEGPHPVLRVVHGGPFAQQEWSVFDEAQVYASAGYAVVLGNPRGSAGYGLDHGRAVIGVLGTVDVDDVLALLDVALERPDLDANRVGIMGGSYGGFMTSWLAAHHGDRFRAAWSERAVNAWDSFAGSSDIGWFFADAYVGSDPAEQRARSPLSYAESVRIPFMVAHSEHDWRCPIEQGQRQFVALRRAGVPAELLVFPGEGHELSRSGRPQHRVQRFEYVLDWWGRHLPVN